ncbi:hypothetical protein BGW41_002242 [Actinomortierella wolfii]|nr:hypothetical protein BGW41_002242 [Actinomortierella wolfii]
MDSITADDFIWLSSAVFKLKAERLHIDITACGEYYIRSFDGGLHDSPSLLATMEQASFLLGAFVYGRCALTGKLFFPKPGQLQGYKNPILEAARLLQCDNEYMAVRCRYRDVFIHPTLVSSEDIRAPEPGWFDWWPHLGFPDTVLNLACRIVMVDLSGRLSYYDVPSTTSAIDPEADILLRPYMPLLEAFRAHGTKWVASEPVLCKVEMMAKVFQVLSLARSQGVEPPSHLYPLTLTSYERAEKRADFRYPLHSPRESDQLSSGLRSALLMTIPRTIDALSRASQYHSLGLMCYQLESFDEGIEYLLIAVELYSIYSTAESMAAGGIRECLTYILRCLYAMLINGRGYGWMLDKEDEEYPMWWSTLHSVFGPTLQEFTLVVQELRASKTDSYRAREAVPLCAEMLLIHLSYAILSWFEKQKDLDGITVVYQILAQLYARGVPKDDDQINRFSSVKKAKETLTVRLTPWVYRDVLDVQRRLKTEDYARNGERNPLIVQEGLMDFYVLNGETNKAMVCALAAVRMQEALWLPINERARILQKAAMIARTARAQHDVGAAMTIVRSAESVLGNRNGRPWREDEQVLKEKLLTSLDEAAQLLQASGQELERSTHRALYRAYMAVAEIRRYERTLAAQWAIAAQIRDRAAMSATDLQELKRYEKTWLVDGKEEIDKKALGQAVLFLVRECTSD